MLSLTEGDRVPLVFRLQPLPRAEAPAAPRIEPAREAQPPRAKSRPVASDVTPPRKLSGRTPDYPHEVLRFRMQGRVIVELTVTERGEPTDLVVIESPGEPLAQAVLEAVRTWRFEPARRNGAPVSVRWRVTQTFTVR
jgi:protein TonB